MTSSESEPPSTIVGIASPSWNSNSIKYPSQSTVNSRSAVKNIPNDALSLQPSRNKHYHCPENNTHYNPNTNNNRPLLSAPQDLPSPTNPRTHLEDRSTNLQPPELSSPPPPPQPNSLTHLDSTNDNHNPSPNNHNQSNRKLSQLPPSTEFSSELDYRPDDEWPSISANSNIDNPISKHSHDHSPTDSVPLSPTAQPSQTNQFSDVTSANSSLQAVPDPILPTTPTTSHRAVQHSDAAPPIVDQEAQNFNCCSFCGVSRILFMWMFYSCVSRLYLCSNDLIWKTVQNAICVKRFGG